MRQCANLSHDANDPTVDENRHKIQDENVNSTKVSYKMKLMGIPKSQISMVDMDKEFELHEGNVAMKVDGVPSINFSDLVQQFIARKMAMTMVVKLLRRKLGFSALLYKLSTLWKLVGHLQLMDLKNAFYLVRFHDKSNLDKMLTCGPWVMFGHYLSFRP